MKSLLLASALLASFAASANELVVTATQSRETQGAFDIISTGDAVAFQINLNLGEGQTVDLSTCSGTRNGLQVSCAYAKGQVIVLAYYGDFRSVPAGRINIGSFKSSGGEALSVRHFYAVDKQGVEVNASSRVVSGESTVNPGTPGTGSRG
jgi:hypothetical protein